MAIKLKPERVKTQTAPPARPTRPFAMVAPPSKSIANAGCVEDNPALHSTIIPEY
jgi:hypothetical protein